jgi:hypothetical protein
VVLGKVKDVSVNFQLGKEGKKREAEKRERGKGMTVGLEIRGEGPWKGVKTRRRWWISNQATNGPFGTRGSQLELELAAGQLHTFGEVRIV